MKKRVLGFVLLLATLYSPAQKPKDGTYSYSVAFAEWGGKSHGCTVKVVIKGDSIFVYNDGSLSGSKGELIDAGFIMKHQRTGKYIIGHTKGDAKAKKIGDCDNGPSIIDFKKRRFWIC
jgi:hypothetical protein